MIPSKTVLTADRRERLLPLLGDTWVPPIIRPVVFGEMGLACVDRLDGPSVCSLTLSDFVMYAGDASTRVARYFVDTTERPRFVLPSTPEWDRKIRDAANTRRFDRYSFSSERLDPRHLHTFVDELRDGFELRRFDKQAIEQAASQRWSRSFVENFSNSDRFLQMGIGFGVFHRGALVSGAASFAVYDETVEIEVDTHPKYRRSHLATAASARLILYCLEHGLTPHWDAANLASRALAERLGFTLERGYVVLKI